MERMKARAEIEIDVNSAQVRLFLGDNPTPTETLTMIIPAARWQTAMEAIVNSLAAMAAKVMSSAEQMGMPAKILPVEVVKADA